LHHLGVREHVRPTDLDDAGALRMTDRPDEIVENVTDGDGLTQCPHPAWGDHHREVLHEAAQQLEGSTARADDDRGAKLGDRDGVGSQLRPDLLATGEVGGELAGRVTQATQVDDVTHARLLRASREGARRREVAIAEPSLAAGHGVRQVVGQLDVRERGRQRIRIEQVDAHDLGVGEALGQASRIAAGEANGMALGQQPGRKAATDIAAGADHEDAHRDASPGQAMPRDFSKAICRSCVMPVLKPASLIER
jgi:hypothetical protein